MARDRGHFAMDIYIYIYIHVCVRARARVCVQISNVQQFAVSIVSGSRLDRSLLKNRECWTIIQTTRCVPLYLYDV
jgi:hypothetical protein